MSSGQDAVLEFLCGGDPDAAEHGVRELGEEAFDQVQPGAVLRSEDKFEAAFGLGREPGSCLLGRVG